MKVSLPADFQPRAWQREWMRYFDRGGTRAVGVIHRRGGKDLTELNQTAKRMHQRRGVYWHSLPTYRQAKKAVWDGFRRDGRRTLETVFPGFLDPKRPGSIVAAKNETEMLIELKCGSILQLVGSDSIDSLVGAGPVHVTFSEFALCKPSAWDLVRPILRENSGTAAFLSTPRGRNHLFKLYEMAKGHAGWHAQRLSIHETGTFDDPQAVIDEERREGMPEAMIASEYLCDFTAAVLGSYYGELLTILEGRGGLEPFEHERDAVFTSWDLGHTDSTAIWFWRLVDGGVDVIDHYEAHAKPLSHYYDVLDRWAEERGYRYLKHWLPHDARAKTLQTGESILDQCLERWGHGMVAIVPRLSLEDGIQAVRWLLQRAVRIHPRCSTLNHAGDVDGLECLRQYHQEWDEDRRVFALRPEHDWSSHTADAFRYLALVVRYSELMTRKPKAHQVPEAVAAVMPTMDELWAEHERGRSSRRERI